jgi:hypothetical protein
MSQAILKFNSLQCYNVAWWTFRRWSGKIDLQMFWKVAPPISQLRAFPKCTIPCVRGRESLSGTVEVYEDRIEDLRKATHLDEAGYRMRLFRYILG